MADHDRCSDLGTVGAPSAGALAGVHSGSSSEIASADAPVADRLLDLLERWEVRYRCGEDASPESLGATEPALLGPLRELIRKQKRLYAGLHVAKSPEDDDRGANESLPSFPDHETLREIGRGGMGVVYQARDMRLGRFVAIKTITEFQPASPTQLARFLGEARAAARLLHPNIIAIHAVGEHHARPYLSLEYAPGGDLKQQIAAKPMAPRQAAGLVETLALAVHAAHKAGIVHRDLKPSNILLSAERVPKVADFGLAKLLGNDSDRTQSGQVIGTPSYMAPEQAEGHSKNVGPAVDLYALGAILYEALTGRPPFLGESQLETLKMVTTTEVVPPRRLRPDVPRDLETICLKCLEKDPRKRYASAEALACDLRRFLGDRPIVARRATRPERILRWCRRNPSAAAALAILVVGTAVGTSQAVRATSAEHAARRAAANTRTEKNRAESEAEIAKAVNEFLNKDLLAQASAFNQSSPDKKPDPDLKVRTALDRAAATVGEKFVGKPLIEASIRHTIGETYLNLGLYAQALEHLQLALKLRRESLGDEHPDTLLSKQSIGALYMADGKLSEAEPFLLDAMQGLRNVRGPLHPETLKAIHGVAQLYFYQDKLPDAERLFIEVRDGYLRTRRADPAEAIEVTNSLAMVCVRQKKFEEAEKLLVDVIDQMRNQKGAEHPDSLTAMQNLADVYEARHRRDKMGPLLERVVDLETRSLGRDHPNTLTSAVKLGGFYAYKREFDKAEALLVPALEGCRAKLDAKHETRAGALAALSVVYSLKPDMKKLAPVLIELQEITRFRWGLESELTAEGDHALGLFLFVQKQYAKAESFFREELAIRIKRDPDGWQRFRNESRLGSCLLAQKMYGLAEPLLLSAYRGLKARRDSTPPKERGCLRRTLEQIIRLRDEAGRLDNKAAFDEIRADPDFQNIEFDLKFPANPFGGPLNRPR